MVNGGWGGAGEWFLTLETVSTPADSADFKSKSAVWIGLNYIFLKKKKKNS